MMQSDSITRQLFFPIPTIIKKLHFHSLSLLFIESEHETDQSMPEHRQDALQTIEDCDSLLHMLNKRAQLTDAIPNQSLVANI